jgi:hypothetical protein
MCNDRCWPMRLLWYKGGLGLLDEEIVVEPRNDGFAIRVELSFRVVRMVVPLFTRSPCWVTSIGMPN